MKFSVEALSVQKDIEKFYRRNDGNLPYRHVYIANPLMFIYFYNVTVMALLIIRPQVTVRNI